MKYLLLSILFIGLASCGHHRDGSSVWEELWWLPWLTGIGAAIFWTTTYRSWKSGTKKLRTLTTPESYSKDKFSVWSAGWIIFAIVLTAATIAIIWGVNSEK